MPLSRRALLSLPLAVAARPAAAAGEDAAVAVIRQFYDGLLAVMKAARTLSFDERYQRLAPLIERTYSLPLMTRIAVGPSWPQIPPAQQQALVQAFTRYTVAQYAGRFDDYGGERFEVDPAPAANPNGVVVQSRLVKPNGEKVVLNYVMRQGAGGAWQVIDVYLSGTISELAARRSEFAGVLRSSGAGGLVSMLEQRADGLRTH